jgi:hypothetical protein
MFLCGCSFNDLINESVRTPREYCMIYTVEDQAFLRSYDSGPHPSQPLRPPSRQQVVSPSSLRVYRRSSLLTGEGGSGGGRKSYDREKAWPSINHSIHDRKWKRPSFDIKNYKIIPLVLVILYVRHPLLHTNMYMYIVQLYMLLHTKPITMKP